MVAEKELSWPVLRRGFLYGDGIYDTLRARNFHLFRWHDHGQRLAAGREFFGLASAWNGEALRREMERFLKAAGIADAYVRINCWRTEPASFPPHGERAAHVMVIARPFEPYPAAWYRRGIVCCVSTFRRNERSPLSSVKTLNCGENVAARREAEEKTCADAVFLTTTGRLSEATTSNLFFIRKGIVHTPARSCGILPGVTRKIVFEICRRSGIRYKEGIFPPASLKTADEVFLTNTTAGVLPVREIQGLFRNARGFSTTGLFRKELERIFREETDG